jgi:YD repeat-containing protein
MSHSRNRFARKGNSCYFSIFLFLATFMLATGMAHAQYPSSSPVTPVKYEFIKFTGYPGTTHQVASRMDLCVAFMDAMNPASPAAPVWYNPRLPATIGNYTAHGKSLPEQCGFTSRYGDPDWRSPGVAFCGDTYETRTSSPFDVDPVKMECGCPNGTKWYSDANTCVKTSQLTGASLHLGKGANMGPPPEPDCHCQAPSEPSVGEPINPNTGNMWHVQKDFVASAPGGLELRRVYNSTPFYADSSATHAFGGRWTNIYDASLRQEISSTVTDGSRGVVCWRREDTKFVWCEAPQLPVASSNPRAVSIFRRDGKRYFFNLVNGLWVGDADTNDRVTAQYNASGTSVLGWKYISAQGDVTEHYDVNGLLSSITSRSGVTQTLTYSDGTTNATSISRLPADAPACSHVQDGDVLSAGRLICVTDQWGRQLQFEYDKAGRVTKVLDPKDQFYLYEYDGASGGCPTFNPANPSCTANNLTKVTYPDGKSEIYFYNEAQKINNGQSCSSASVGNGQGPWLNALTGLVDGNGQRYIIWTYDCAGRATSSQLAAGANKVVLAYPTTTGQTLTQYVGDLSNPAIVVSNLSTETKLGVAKSFSADMACADCGLYKWRLHDNNANVSSVTDWNNVTTCYQYDLSRNLEIGRIEGHGGGGCPSNISAETSLYAPERKISTQWHPVFRLVTAIAEAKRLTRFTYDETGNLLTKSKQATTDVSGALGFFATTVGPVRIWTYTYNSTGQLLTVAGPRKDVVDRVTYGYDNLGNLSSITNALGHVTSFSNYDENGNVGTIIQANRSVRIFTYSSRGWVTSSSMQTDGVAENTFYEYDGVGQLTKVTLPDGATLAYTYDTAHRLIAISDALGNTVRYTLDVRGNRTSEQIIDPNGALVRQISRVFDVNDRVTKLTGQM